MIPSHECVLKLFRNFAYINRLTVLEQEEKFAKNNSMYTAGLRLKYSEEESTLESIRDHRKKVE